MGEFGKVNENTSFDGVNWDAISHQQLWDWFGNGRVDAIEQSRSYWGEAIAPHFQAAADKVATALTTANVIWEGAAADAMTRGTAPLVDHARSTFDAAALAGEMTGQQSSSAIDLASRMPEPRPMPTQQQMIDAAGGNMFLYLDDVAEQESASKEAAERARDLVKEYDRGTDHAVAELPRFAMAPTVTTGVSDTPPPGPGVIEYGQPVSGPPEVGPDGAPAGPRGPGGSGGPGGSSSGPDSVSQAPPVASQDAVAPGGTSSQSLAPSVSAAPSATSGPQGPSGGLGSTGGFGPTGGLAPGLVVGGPGSAGGGRSAGRPGGSGGFGAGGRGEAGPGARGGPGSGVRAVQGAIEEPITRSGQAAPPRAGTGMAPMAAGAPRNRDETDEEHTTPTYLVDHHDDFWDDTPAVAPAVIGEDDD